MADNKSSEGKVIGGKRKCGKTTKLIRRASEEQLYILCGNKTMAKFIFKQAQEMDLQIPYPITFEDLPLKGYMKEILVDEVEMVLSQLVGKRVVGMSTSYEMEELPSLDHSSSKKKNNVGELTVDVDCSEALKGLKAVQKEAKKATAALKEFEEQKKRNMSLPSMQSGGVTSKPLSISSVSDKDMWEEIHRRRLLGDRA